MRKYRKGSSCIERNVVAVRKDNYNVKHVPENEKLKRNKLLKQHHSIFSLTLIYSPAFSCKSSPEVYYLTAKAIHSLFFRNKDCMMNLVELKMDYTYILTLLHM